MTVIQRLSISFSTIGQFWQEKINGTIFRWNLFFLFVQLIILFIKFNDLPPQLPLYYSQPWGSSQLANSMSIFLLPLFSFVVMIINNILATSFLKSVPLLSKLLVIISLIFTVYASITLYQIVTLIT